MGSRLLVLTFPFPFAVLTLIWEFLLCFSLVHSSFASFLLSPSCWGTLGWEMSSPPAVLHYGRKMVFAKSRNRSSWLMSEPMNPTSRGNFSWIKQVFPWMFFFLSHCELLPSFGRGSPRKVELCCSFPQIPFADPCPQGSLNYLGRRCWCLRLVCFISASAGFESIHLQQDTGCWEDARGFLVFCSVFPCCHSFLNIQGSTGGRSALPILMLVSLKAIFPWSL